MSMPNRFTLYIAGDSELGTRAERNLRQLVSSVGLDLDLEVVDITRVRDAARSGRVIATPLLVRHEPAPEVRILGDLSDAIQVAEVLGFPSRDADEPASR